MIVRIFFSSCVVFFLSISSTFAWGFIVESIGQEPTITARKHLIEVVLSRKMLDFRYEALMIILDSAQKEPRGKMTGKNISLSPTVLRDGEFLQLLLHEIGHYVDIYTLSRTSGVTDDPSELFYRISWEGKTTKKASQTAQDFISGYAATNQYEDFAESFTYFIFHNEDFADRALKNTTLREKYLFFSEYVFPKGDFAGTDFGTSKSPSYFWDTTKIPISVKKYLYSLK